MSRSVFARAAVRTVGALAALSAVLLVWPSAWVALGVGAAVALWLAWQFARIAMEDEAVLRAAVHALAEGREIEASPVLRGHDRLLATIVAASLDVRQNLELSVARREKLEALLDSMPDAVTSVDGGGRIIWANKAMQRLVNTFGSVRAGHSLVQTIRAPEVLECMQAVLQSRSLTESRTVSLSPGHLFSVSAAPMPDGGAVVVLRDMTRLEQGERAQREFVANVSHELRTPLTSIQGYVEMLLDGEDQGVATGEEREFLEAILKSARRMARLTDDLLALARVESGEQKLEPRPVAVKTLIEEATGAVAGLVKEKNGSLSVGPLPELDVLADQDAVVQILSNLVANALSYGRPSNGVSRVELTAQGGAGTEVRFGVRDFGEGIASEHLHRLFERFYRVDKVRSRDSGGTGLGLAIAKQLVEAQHGTIWVESTLGRGSVFYFTLPRAGVGTGAAEVEVGSLPMLL